MEPYLLGFLVDPLVDALVRLLPTAALAWDGLGLGLGVRGWG